MPVWHRDFLSSAGAIILVSIYKIGRTRTMRRVRMSVLGVLAFVAILAAFPFQALAGNPEFLIPLDHPYAAFLESRAVAPRWALPPSSARWKA